MPKTATNLWGSLVQWDNIYTAYIEARRGKRYQGDVVAFSERLEENLFDIQNELMWHRWRPQPMKTFVVQEPKRRQISAPAFRDRIVHHALVRVIEPLFERRFVDHNYACRVGKGALAAADRVQRLLRSASKSPWFLQGDIRGYFPSVDHDVLKRIIRRTIRDANALTLIDVIIDNHAPGLPIGALTSQLFANAYLDLLDHFIMDNLGWGAYTRYMDDFVVVSAGRGDLLQLEAEARSFIQCTLKLQLNEKTKVARGARGIDFCGYRIFQTHRLPRKRNIKRAKRRLKAIARKAASAEDARSLRASLMSFLGYMKHCNGYRSTKSVLDVIKIGGTK